MNIQIPLGQWLSFSGNQKLFRNYYDPQSVMHEMSLAINIVDIAAAAARKEGARRISLIELEVGAMSGVMVDSLEFCFEAASRNTPAQGADLKIITIDGQGTCPACAAVVVARSFRNRCPQCGEYMPAAGQGDALRVRAVTIED